MSVSNGKVLVGTGSTVSDFTLSPLGQSHAVQAGFARTGSTASFEAFHNDTLARRALNYHLPVLSCRSHWRPTLGGRPLSSTPTSPLLLPPPQLHPLAPAPQPPPPLPPPSPLPSPPPSPLPPPLSRPVRRPFPTPNQPAWKLLKPRRLRQHPTQLIVW